MSDVSMLDTNVVIYLFDSRNTEKQAIAERLVSTGLKEGTHIISPQVVQEALNVALSKLGFTPDDAHALLKRTLMPLCKLVSPALLYERALSVRSRYQYSFYDSLIIAAALELGCKMLYSEDLQHQQKIDRLRIVNPFVT